MIPGTVKIHFFFFFKFESKPMDQCHSFSSLDSSSSFVSSSSTPRPPWRHWTGPPPPLWDRGDSHYHWQSTLSSLLWYSTDRSYFWDSFRYVHTTYSPSKTFCPLQVLGIPANWLVWNFDVLWSGWAVSLEYGCWIPMGSKRLVRSFSYPPPMVLTSRVRGI